MSHALPRAVQWTLQPYSSLKAGGGGGNSWICSHTPAPRLTCCLTLGESFHCSEVFPQPSNRADVSVKGEGVSRVSQLKANVKRRNVGRNPESGVKHGLQSELSWFCLSWQSECGLEKNFQTQSVLEGSEFIKSREQR